MILAIDPGNEKSAYVVMGKDLCPLEFEKAENKELLINPGAVCDRFGGGVAYADIRVADNGGVRVSLCKWE